MGAEIAAQAGLKTTVITRDKDLAQLVRPGDTWWDWGGGIQRDHSALIDHWQVQPQQIPDLLALMGDSADNIPGISGVGEKSARILLQHFASLEMLYGALEAVLVLDVRGARRLYNALLDTEEQAFLFRELIRLHPPAADLSLKDLCCQPADKQAVLAFIEQEGLGTQFFNLVIQHYA